MADFADYRRAQHDVSRLYADRDTWNRMSLMNIANSGIFSADRAVFEYARNIWHAEPVQIKHITVGETSDELYLQQL